MALPALLFGVGIAAAAPAQAAVALPDFCQEYNVGYMVTGVCGLGSGSYKEAITCKNWWGYWAYREGPQVPAGWGNWSRATCPAGYTVQGHWILRYP